MTNLLDNAMRHARRRGDPSGGLAGESTASGRSGRQRAGVDAALRDDLFQRPSALSTQASREDRGGLGLLIVKRMLELNGAISDWWSR
ncbi:hypothetical protein ACHWUR_20805 [Klebsiella pneumoniae]